MNVLAPSYYRSNDGNGVAKLIGGPTLPYTIIVSEDRIGAVQSNQLIRISREEYLRRVQSVPFIKQEFK